MPLCADHVAVQSNDDDQRCSVSMVRIWVQNVCQNSIPVFYHWPNKCIDRRATLIKIAHQHTKTTMNNKGQSVPK